MRNHPICPLCLGRGGWSPNWGLIFAIRTGSADYSHRVLACGWVRNGYKSADGMLSRDGVAVAVPEERDLFRLAGVPWVEPEARNLHSPNTSVCGSRDASTQDSFVGGTTQGEKR